MQKIIRKGGREVLKLNNTGKVPYLSFPMLDLTDGVLHGFSTRLGGVSKEHLSSMNLSFSRGDHEENVKENFRRIADAIGFRPENMVFSHQTHTTNVHVVTQEDKIGRAHV